MLGTNMTKPKHSPKAIESLAFKGLSRRGVAASLGVPHSTFADRMDADPRLKLAYEKGRAKLDEKINGKVFQRAFADTAEVQDLKLACDRFDGAKEKQTQSDVQITIGCPPAMSDEDFQKLITVDETTKDKS